MFPDCTQLVKSPVSKPPLRTRLAAAGLVARSSTPANAAAIRYRRMTPLPFPSVGHRRSPYGVDMATLQTMAAKANTVAGSGADRVTTPPQRNGTEISAKGDPSRAYR